VIQVKIPEDTKPLLQAQAIVYVLFMLKDPKDKKKVLKKAKERIGQLGVSEELLDHANDKDVRLYTDEAVERLEQKGFNSRQAHETVSDYRAKMFRELGVKFGKGGARVA
jgi:phosphotransacetylase